MAPSTRNARRSATIEPGMEEHQVQGSDETIAGPSLVAIEQGAPSLLSAGETPSPIPGGDGFDALRLRHAEVKRKLAQRRLEQEMQAMEQELQGQEPTQYVEVAGTTLPNRKRAVSVSRLEDAHLTKIVKLAQPPSFTGKVIEDLRKYDIGWKKIFKTMPHIADNEYANRVRTAATFLKDRAEEAWERDDPEFTKWDDYITYLKGIIATPAIRKSQALMQLAETKQRPGQSVRDLLTKIEVTEADIPQMTEDEQKAWILLNALSPALRAEVMHEFKEIQSREQVLNSAQRHEEVIRQRNKSEAPKTQPVTAQITTTTRTYHRGTHRGRSRTATQSQDPATNDSKQGDKQTDTKDKEKSKDSCGYCRKPGHKTSDCYILKRKREAGDSQPKNKTTEKEKSKN